MMRIFLLFICFGLSSANEHWFVFDQNQFPGFNTPLFTLISSTNNSTNLSFTLSNYERAIYIENSNEEPIKLSIERADLLSNTLHHLIFIAVRNQTKFETYVNCKLIDSYLLYSLGENSSYQIENLTEGIKHNETTIDQLFDQYDCKQTSPIIVDNNQTTTAIIGKPLIRKMQYLIEKVQKGKQRSKRHLLTSDSLTIIYKPNITQSEGKFHTIINASQFSFHIRYYPNEHLFYVQFHNENRTQLVLYADKTTDLNSSSTPSVLFLHITPIMISCYVNCELTDQEFIGDTLYVQNLIRQAMERSNENQRKQFVEYDRQSTLILFNKSIDQTATNFFCLKLDKKNEDLLPDKYALRKFANALDILMNNLDTPSNEQTATPNISTVNIHSINGFGSLLAPSSNKMSSEIYEYDRTCFNDQDCSSTNSSLKCQQGRCVCPARYFWSTTYHRCISCKDLSIGNRCFRLSNHKSTWYEANDYCRDENSFDEQQYTMKLTSNLNRTDIELLKQSLIHEDNGEQLDYFYWIGSISRLDTRKNSRSKRQIPSKTFRWYDNGAIVQLNLPNIWCEQREQPLNHNEQCISLTSCGLYADDCQRNYRFICEAV